MTTSTRHPPGETRPTVRSVLKLGDSATLSPGIAGGKAAALAALLRAGFPVPRGLVIPVGAVDYEVELLARARALARASSLVVRSSGVTEDGRESSRAGRFLTVLGVRGDRDLLAAVLACRRSGAEAGEPMALLVQPLVKAEVSGVLFTADPVDGNPERIRIAATAGAAGVVDGEDAEEVVLDALTGETRSETAGAAALLSDALRMRLHHLALRIEEVRGDPQDLEWAASGGRIVLLQARPITALRSRFPAPAIGVEHRLAFPGRFSPFGRSLEAAKLPLYNRAARRHTGRDAEYRILCVSGFLFERIEWRRRPMREALHSLAALLPGPARIRAFRGRTVPVYLRRVRQIEGETGRVHTVPAAVAALRAAVETYLRFQEDSLRVALPVERFPVLYRRAAALLAPGADAQAWLAGAAETTRRRDLLLSVPGALRDRRVLREAGYLAVPGNPRDPGRAGLRLPDPDAPPMPAPRRGAGRPIGVPGGFLARAILRPLLRLAREHQSFREEKNHLFYRGVWAIRHALAALGRVLVQEDVFEVLADAAMLSLDEATRVPEDWRAHFAGIAGEMAARRRSEAHASRLRPPASLGPAKAPEGRGTASPRGRPGAPGSATGVARVITGPEDFARFRKGEILVCPRFRPFFTPLLDRAAAVVAEEGTALSHAATLAREYGVPAVVGVAGACGLFPDGTRLVVDGAAGTVEPEVAG